ncbi:CKLF-like MARVEL transmembrane domain-containing protein 8 [Danio aesculapii]|uniref:CKLF-like MARVEL transmembrane domain-containing protein 8 n=1 Tax=Danio aesculapii TaxID=1142201 RepID=UPI0024BFB0FB|nr:CKLF-like MARVEL transmembrane domain-containing protein 8 [Danio aesculapii]
MQRKQGRNCCSLFLLVEIHSDNKLFGRNTTCTQRNTLGLLRFWVAFMAENTNSKPVVTTASSPYLEFGNSSTGTLWYDRESFPSVANCLVFAEIILGLLVWPLIASTEYFRFSPFGWVMFVTVFYWLLTLFLLIINVANRHRKHMQWTTVVLIFNCTAALFYTSAAIVEAALLNQVVKGHHTFNCWAASTFFAFLVSLSYAGSAFFTYKSWKRDE